MKIIHLIPEFNRGGTERIVINLARHQLVSGHSVKIIAFSKLNLYEDETQGLPIDICADVDVQYRFMRKPKTRNLEVFESILHEFKPDVIHSHSYWTDLIINAIPILDVQYVSHFHLYYDHYKFKISLRPTAFAQWRGLQILYRAYENRKTKFITISNDVFDYYKMCFPTYLTKNLNKIPNFLQFSPDSSPLKIIPGQKIKILSVGRLVPIKNHIFQIEIAHSLMKMGVDFHLTIAGDGPERIKLESYSKELGLDEIIDFCGIINDMPTLYKSHDIYVHTALAEPFGLTILEAMAFGLPCFVYNTKGPHEIISSRDQGVFIDCLDPDLFAQKILNVTSDVGKYQNISKAAIERSKYFNLDTYAEQIMTTYLQLD